MSLQQELETNKLTDKNQTDPAKSPICSWELPTGLLDDSGQLHKEAVVRELTGYEEDILTSRKMSIFRRMQEIIERCTLSIGNIDQKDPKWSKYISSLTVGDRLFLMLKIRQVSLGDNYAFRIQCPNCGTISNQIVNLNDFKIEGMKNPTERIWEGILPKSGKKYKAKVQTGIEEEKISKFDTASNDYGSLVLLARLVEIDGINPVTLEMVKELPMADRIFLRKDLGDHEGEIDKDIEIQCPSCSYEFKSEIDIGNAGFFFPSEM